MSGWAHRAVRSAFALGLAACGIATEGPGGDAPRKPKADAFGGGERVRDVVKPATWVEPGNADSEACASIPAEREVAVTGVTVMAVDRYDETGEGAFRNVYVQDTLLAPEPYSGVTVYSPGYSPPDLRVVAGDVVDLAGSFEEFAGPPGSSPFKYCRTLPEMKGTMALRFEGVVLEPVVIEPKVLGAYDTARPYFGMLVTLKDVVLACDPYEKGGRFSIGFSVGEDLPCQDLPSISNELFDLKGAAPSLAKGQTLASVTGIVTFFYDANIAPRSAADVVP
jgi:hypothetical protein